jgi:hypothetical protein
MIAAHARRAATSAVLILAVALLVSGGTSGSESDGQPIDPATQAAWLEEHFRCDHRAEMPHGQPIDPATQAAWLEEHFRCDHRAEVEKDSRSA